MILRSSIPKQTSQEDTQTFFPVNPITKEPILITKSVHNSNTEQQELSIEGKANIKGQAKNADSSQSVSVSILILLIRKEFDDAYESQKESVSQNIHGEEK